MSMPRPFRFRLHEAVRRPACFCRPLAIVLLLSFSSLQSASAINIIIHLGDEDENPPYDSDGSRLEAMFNAAATIWEDYLPGAGTYDVDVFWSQSEFDDEPNTLACWHFDNVGNDNIYVRPYPINSNWFIDPTPLNHSEYDFETINLGTNDGQRVFRGGNFLYRDLTSAEKTGWFDGFPSSLLEVGYRGRAPENSILKNQSDLLSTIIHELGHHLGVNSSGGPWTANQAFLPSGGVIMEEDDEGGHLKARSSLMCAGCGLTGTRRLPSAIDIMAVADDEDFDVIDLPRQDFIGNGTWQDGSHWFGGAPPDGDDFAFVRASAAVVLSSNAHVEGLVLAENGLVHTLPHKLTVDDNITVMGPSNTSLIVASGGEVETPALDIDGGTVSLADGVLDVNGPLNINGSSSLLRGRGTVQLAGQLDNNGQIRVDIPGTLTLSPSFFDGGSVDLDGTGEDGFVNLSDGNLTISGLGGLTDDFDGVMIIGPSNELNVSAFWTLGADGVLIMQGDGLVRSIAKGGTVRVRGSVFAEGGDFGEFQAAQIFENTAEVTVAANSFLWLTGSTTYQGGSFMGDGLINQIGNATVVQNTQIDTARYDMDGLESSPASVTVNQGREFVINSQRIDSLSSDGFDGTINLNGGTLDVRTHDLIFINDIPNKNAIPWRMEGTLDLNPVGSSTPARVEGSRMIVGNPANPFGQIGRINAASGWSRISAPVTFEGSTQVVLASGARLSLEYTGPTIYRGGSFTGTGELEQTGDALVEADTHILVQHYDMDGANEDAAITIERLIDFDIDPFQIEDSGTGGDGFDGTVILNGGRLIVRPHRFIGIVGQPPQRSEFSWRMEGRLELNYNNWPATVGGNQMIIGEPDTSQPPATVRVSPGRTNITSAAVRFEPRSVLEIELGGTADNEFGRFNVITDLILDGMLNVSLVNGFTPTVGDSFLIASALGDFTGMFDSAVFPGGQWGLTYSSQNVMLEYLSDLLAGDFDGDGDVDGNDFLFWQRNPSVGNLADWQTNFGMVSPLTATSAAVPEPGGTILIALATIVLYGRGGLSPRESIESKID